MIDRKHIDQANRLNRDPLNQAALLHLRKAKQAPAAGVLHVLSLMRWWLEENGPSLGAERDSVEARVAQLAESDPQAALTWLQDPQNLGDQALDPRELKKAKDPASAGWLLIDLLIDAMTASNDPLGSSWTAR